MTDRPPDLTDDELATLERLLAKVSGRGAMLPWPLFRFINEVTATPNVDLLVRDETGRSLLAWRDDPFGTGWHVPGSIIRHREEIGHRLAETAAGEFGCELTIAPHPCALIEIFDDRGHSVSLCFAASLAGDPARRPLDPHDRPEPGDLRWFQTPPPPEEWYPSHRIYAEILPNLQAAAPTIPIFTAHVGARDAAIASAEGAIGSDLPLA